MMGSGLGRRANPPSPAMRLAALGLVVLVPVNLVLELSVTGESALWFNLSHLVADLLEISFAPNARLISLVLSGLLLLLALLLWFSGSRVVALLLFAMAAWEIFFRVQQLMFVIEEGYTIGLPMLSGVICATLMFLFATAATVSSLAQIRRKRWWR